MRLIDVDKLWDSIKKDVAPFNVAMISRHIHSAPTIDPETLPIVQELKEQLAKVTAERDAAIFDMEALMWHSGDGCKICKHCVKIHKTPYVKLSCKLGGSYECMPKWKGMEENTK